MNVIHGAWRSDDAAIAGRFPARCGREVGGEGGDANSDRILFFSLGSFLERGICCPTPNRTALSFLRRISMPSTQFYAEVKVRDYKDRVTCERLHLYRITIYFKRGKKNPRIGVRSAGGTALSHPQVCSRQRSGRGNCRARAAAIPDAAGSPRAPRSKRRQHPPSGGATVSPASQRCRFGRSTCGPGFCAPYTQCSRSSATL